MTEENLEMTTDQHGARIEDIYEFDKNGRLKVKSSVKFIKMLLTPQEEGGTLSDSETCYRDLYIYGMKQVQILASELPQEEKENVLNFAIAKSINTYDPECGTNLLTYFYQKIRGEITSYRTKKFADDRKTKKMANNLGSDEMVDLAKEYDDKTGQNRVELITRENMVDEIIEESAYKRKIKALKQAYAGLPRKLQLILNETGNGKKTKHIAEILDTTPSEVRKLKNQALALIIQRLLRGYHLREDEKNEILEVHGINPEDLKRAIEEAEMDPGEESEEENGGEDKNTLNEDDIFTFSGFDEDEY